MSTVLAVMSDLFFVSALGSFLLASKPFRFPDFSPTSPFGFALHFREDTHRSPPGRIGLREPNTGRN